MRRRRENAERGEIDARRRQSDVARHVAQDQRDVPDLRRDEDEEPPRLGFNLYRHHVGVPRRALVRRVRRGARGPLRRGLRRVARFASLRRSFRAKRLCARSRRSPPNPSADSRPASASASAPCDACATRESPRAPPRDSIRRRRVDAIPDARDKRVRPVRVQVTANRRRARVDLLRHLRERHEKERNASAHARDRVDVTVRELPPVVDRRPARRGDFDGDDFARPRARSIPRGARTRPMRDRRAVLGPRPHR